jgi:hypothetical protein
MSVNIPGRNRPAKKAFRFFECASLLQPTGRHAKDLVELVSLISEVGPGVIYHHTHQYYFKAAIETPEYSNDFAVWAAESLEERALAEKLASLDLYACPHIEEVRQGLIRIIESYPRENPSPRPARSGDEFFFNDAVTIVMEADPVVENLPDFIEALHTVGTSSIYFHFFEARMRLRRPSDDFSAWLDQGLGRPDLARQIRAIDPYQYSLEGLRRQIILLLQ